MENIVDLDQSICTLQVDADREAWAYARLDRTERQCELQMLSYFERLKEQSGVKKLNLHVSLGNRGGRTEIATVLPYQGNRVGVQTEEKLQRIRELREFIAEIRTDTMTGIAWRNQEADDGLCQIQFKNFDSVITSQDKDLRMVEGWHYIAKTNEFWYTDAFGELQIRDDKVWGCGTKWFWAQMLMGDRVDNIPGLEKLSGAMANKYLPVKTSAGRTPKPCGEKTAYKVLLNADTDKNCFNNVFECYESWYGIDASARFLEQAILLWIRRQESALDVMNFLTPLGFSYKISTGLLERLATWL